MNASQLRNQFAQAKEQLQEAPEYMRPAKTAAQRQAERAGMDAMNVEAKRTVTARTKG